MARTRAAVVARDAGGPAPAARLKITEVFHSIQGEALAAGWPTVFVRLTGCPLRCRYCDTAYAFGGGAWRELDELVAEVGSYGARHVCVTGGEPLAQPRCHALLSALCDAGFEVCLETSGAIDFSAVDTRVSRIVDIKTPASAESARNLWPHFATLNERDAIKFVICNRADYEWARHVLATRPELRHGRLDDLRCTVFFSPSYQELAAAELAEWILADRLLVRLQVQLHKTLWGETPGR